MVSFANARGWEAKDGRVYFPEEVGGEGEGEEVLGGGAGRGTGTSGVIENALGYARELEMIV